jgi:hypothetical protein
MNEQLTSQESVVPVLDPERKREYLSTLSELVWDIEARLAQVKAARAQLMSSLQADIRAQS